MTDEQKLADTAVDYLTVTKVIIDQLLSRDSKPELRLITQRLQLLTWHALSREEERKAANER